MTTLLRPKRINSIDALRGFALAGVAIVHMLEQYLAGPGPEGFMEGGDINDNLYMTALVGFGVQYHLSNKIGMYFIDLLR